MLGSMKPTLSNSCIGLYSNSPYLPTGYGQQGGYLVDKLLEHGSTVAALSNYGLQGQNIESPSKHGTFMHYGQSFDPYGNDIHPANWKHFRSRNKGKTDLLITLYDTWVFNLEAWQDAPRILSWTPLDHFSMPPKVLRWISQERVTPVAMSPFGVRQMAASGIEAEYVPHVIDTAIYKPTHEVNGGSVRDSLGIRADQFLVGMVAANKADSALHRKAFYENLLAFSIFRQDHPDAVIYIHTDVHGSAGGWNLQRIFTKVGLPKEAVLMPNQVLYRWGYEQTEMAALYTAFDVTLATSYGEGFGVGTIESAASGTPVIVSNFMASPDLIAPEHRRSVWEGGLAVNGQPIWHPGLDSEFCVPNVQEIVKALENAYEMPRGVNAEALEWSKNFDIDHVWKNHWMPLLEKVLS